MLVLDTLPGKSANDFTLIIGGREIVVESGKFIRTMDTAADACTVSMPWFPGKDTELDNLTRPYSYADATLYIGGDLQMTGRLYDVTPSIDSGGRVRELGCYSKTADIIDSSVVPPYEANNIKFSERCRQQCNAYGIDVIVGDGVNLLTERRVIITPYFIRANALQNLQAPAAIQNYLLGADMPQILPVTGSYRRTEMVEPKFSRVSAEQTDTVFEHLRKLSKQRGLLLSCTRYGQLLITEANLQDAPVGTIREGDWQAEKFSAKFSGRNRFAFYRALASSSRSSRAMAASTAQDNAVPVPRKLTFRADDSLPGECGTAAEWRKNKSAADAMTLMYPVNTWYAPNGKLWQPNTQITVISETIGVPDGFSFLITQVEFDFKDSGLTATLNLKPPTMYSTGEVSEPWSE